MCCLFFSPYFFFITFLFSSLPVLGRVLKVFNWSYFTAKIMDTVNISVPDTERVINYSPNYYRRLNLVLARYTKRCVRVCLCMIACLWGWECTTWPENSCSLITDLSQLGVSKEVFVFSILPLLTGICRTTWCGVLPWTWSWAWAELTGTPGKPFAWYTYNIHLTINVSVDKHNIECEICTGVTI